MSVAIVDYCSRNLHSAAKAFERAARESGQGQPIVVTGDPAPSRGLIGSSLAASVHSQIAAGARTEFPE